MIDTDFRGGFEGIGFGNCEERGFERENLRKNAVESAGKDFSYSFLVLWNTFFAIFHQFLTKNPHQGLEIQNFYRFSAHFSSIWAISNDFFQKKLLHGLQVLQFSSILAHKMQFLRLQSSLSIKQRKENQFAPLKVLIEGSELLPTV